MKKLIFILGFICTTKNTHAQKRVIEKNIYDTTFINQFLKPNTRVVVNTIPNSIVQNDKRFAIDSSHNNGNGFDVYTGRLDNMPTLMPDAGNKASLKIAEKKLIEIPIHNISLEYSNKIKQLKPPTQQQLDALNQLLH